MTKNAPLSIRYIRKSAVPIIQQVIDTLGIESFFEEHVKHDVRDKLPVTRVLVSALCNYARRF
jgi:hypothetical protein